MTTSNRRPFGKCCEECLYPTHELWAHQCPRCRKQVHILCAHDWGIPPDANDEFLCRVCHFSSFTPDPPLELPPNPSITPESPPARLSNRLNHKRHGRRAALALTPSPQISDRIPETRMSQIERLELVAQQQKRTSVLDATVASHMSRVKVLTRVLWKIKELRAEAFELDATTRKPLRYTGSASKIYRLKLPMAVRIATLLFAQVSIDPDLANRKRKKLDVSESDSDDDNQLIVDLIDIRAPAKDVRTVSAQTYQNYKSALKW